MDKQFFLIALMPGSRATAKRKGIDLGKRFSTRAEAQGYAESATYQIDRVVLVGEVKDIVVGVPA